MCELIHEGQPTTRAVGQGTGHLIKVGSEAGTAVLTFLKRASALQLREYSKAELLCPSSPPPQWDANTLPRAKCFTLGGTQTGVPDLTGHQTGQDVTGLTDLK